MFNKIAEQITRETLVSLALIPLFLCMLWVPSALPASRSATAPEYLIYLDKYSEKYPDNYVLTQLFYSIFHIDDLPPMQNIVSQGMLAYPREFPRFMALVLELVKNPDARLFMLLAPLAPYVEDQSQVADLASAMDLANILSGKGASPAVPSLRDHIKFYDNAPVLLRQRGSAKIAPEKAPQPVSAGSFAIESASMADDLSNDPTAASATGLAAAVSASAASTSDSATAATTAASATAASTSDSATAATLSSAFAISTAVPVSVAPRSKDGLSFAYINNDPAYTELHWVKNLSGGHKLLSEAIGQPLPEGGIWGGVRSGVQGTSEVRVAYYSVNAGIIAFAGPRQLREADFYANESTDPQLNPNINTEAFDLRADGAMPRPCDMRVTVTGYGSELPPELLVQLEQVNGGIEQSDFLCRAQCVLSYSWEGHAYSLSGKTCIQSGWGVWPYSHERYRELGGKIAPIENGQSNH